MKSKPVGRQIPLIQRKPYAQCTILSVMYLLQN